MKNQKLFNYLHDLGVIALESELQEIERIVLSMQQERMYSEEDMKESFIEGYKQRAEKSDLIFDNASRMYAIHLFEQFKNK